MVDSEKFLNKNEMNIEYKLISSKEILFYDINDSWSTVERFEKLSFSEFLTLPSDNKYNLIITIKGKMYGILK